MIAIECSIPITLSCDGVSKSRNYYSVRIRQDEYVTGGMFAFDYFIVSTDGNPSTGKVFLSKEKINPLTILSVVLDDYEATVNENSSNIRHTYEAQSDKDT